MRAPTDIDRQHLARAIELAEGGRGRVSPNPLVGAVIGRDERDPGRGLSPDARRPARRGRGDRGRGRPRPGRRDAVRVTRALLPPGPHAAVHGGDPRGRDRARGRRLGRPERARLRPRARHPARRGGRGRRRRRRAGRPRPPDQPAVSQARPDRPAVGAVQVGDDARRQGRHARRRLEVDLRRGEPRAWPITGGPVRRGGGRDRHRAGRRPATDGADRRSACASPAGSCSTRWPACRSARKLVRDARKIPLDRRRLPRRSARRHRCPRDPRRRHRSWPPARTRPPACARRSTISGADGVGSILLEGGPHLAGAFLDAGEVDEMRLFLAPMVLGGRTARDPLEGEGVEAIADAARALTLDCEQVGDDLLVSARIGSGTGVHRPRARDGSGRVARGERGRGRASRSRRRWPRSSRAGIRSRSTACA